MLYLVTEYASGGEIFGKSITVVTVYTQVNNCVMGLRGPQPRLTPRV